MKKIRLLPIFLIVVLLSAMLAPQALALEQPEVSSKAAILVDTDSGRVLYEIRGVSLDLAREALTRAAHKLPVKTVIVVREGL